MSKLTPRLYSFLVGAMLVGFGLACAVWPDTMGALTDLRLPTATATTDLRAVYGGQSIGIGVLILVWGAKLGLVRRSLYLVTAMFGGMGIARLFGVMVDGDPSAVTIVAIVVELGLAVVAQLLLRRPKELAAAPA